MVGFTRLLAGREDSLMNYMPTVAVPATEPSPETERVAAAREPVTVTSLALSAAERDELQRGRRCGPHAGHGGRVPGRVRGGPRPRAALGYRTVATHAEKRQALNKKQRAT